MNQSTPVTQVIKASVAGRSFRQILEQVSRNEARVVVEDHGEPVAAVISPRDLDRLIELERQIGRDLAVLDASQAAFDDAAGEELEAEIVRAIAEVRAEHTARSA